MNRWCRKTLCILGLCLCLTAAGCGEKAEEADKKAEVNKDEVVDADGVLLKVNKEKITEKEARLYWLMLQEQYEDVFGSQVWDLKISGQETLQDEAVRQMVEEMIQVHLLCQKAEELEITVDSEDEASLKAAVEEYYAQLDSELKTRYELSYEDVYQVYYECLLAETVFEISTNDVNTTIPDHVARQCRIYCIYLPADGEDVQEQMKSIREKAEAITELEEMKVLAEGNTKGREAEMTLGENTEGLDETFKEAVLELKSGELSEIIQGEDGCYLAYCVNETDEDATHARKTEMILENQREMFQSTYQGWEAEAEIKKYDEQVRKFLTNLK